MVIYFLNFGLQQIFIIERYMERKVFAEILVFAVFLATFSHALPFTFSSAHTEEAFRFKLEVEPNTQFFLYSKKFVKTPDHWTRVRSFGSDLTVQPRFDRENVLFNQKHEGKYHLAYHTQVGPQEIKTSTRHLHYVNTRFEGNEVGLLLPSFASEVRYMRTDRLFRCSNTILSVEWEKNDAYIVALSLHDRWKLVENIDNGFINEERGIQYGSAVDFGHVHPIQIQVGNHGHYCLISTETQSAQINFNWEEESYSLDRLLDLVGQSLPILNKRAKTYADQL